MKYLLILLILTGCGQGVIPPASNKGVFEPYYQLFKTSAIKYNRYNQAFDSIVIRFEPLFDRHAASCAYYFGYREVGVDPTIWSDLPEDYKITVIFHELGHCLLNQSHRPNSIMSPDVLRFDNFDAAIEELFTFIN